MKVVFKFRTDSSGPGLVVMRSASSGGFAAAILFWGMQGGARRQACDDRRKGGEAPLRVREAPLRVRYRPYGSAASRRPSPRKLKAMTATMTGMDGIISHGEIATVCTFCA